MRAEQYTHYGVPVIFQWVEKPFADILGEKGVEYIELPIFLNKTLDRVISYSVDGIKKYAVLINRTTDNMVEQVYITTEIPADLDFQALADDVDRQRYGEEPTQIISRLTKVVEAVHTELERDWQEKVGMLESMATEMPMDKQYYSTAQRMIMNYGYDDLGKLVPEGIDSNYWAMVVNGGEN